MHTMKTRVTMTLDPQLHARAKRLARQRRTSVSGLFEAYLREQPDPAGSQVEKLIGSGTLKKPGTTPDPRREALIEKYLHE